MAHDLVIRGGLIVDGTGAPGRAGDLAVSGGRIAEVGAVSGRGAREVDARGLVVAPGFIDPHTHYDAQLTWDPSASCTSWHGVTTIVTGNCGFTLAPCRPEDRLTLMKMLEYVEGIRWRRCRRASSGSSRASASTWTRSTGSRYG
jgi:N-acyl-D-amino-acid deacylase